MVLIIMNPGQIGILIEKYASGTITPEELDLLHEWYGSVNQQDVTWPVTRANGKHELHSKMLARLNSSIGATPAKVVSFPVLKIAAAVVVMIGLAVFGYYFASSESSQFYTVTNTHGKVQVVHLPDSSKVWLNAATTLRYSASFKTHRQLELEGEAFFDVTKDNEHPFAIKTGEITTTVVGTSFSVSAYDNDELKTISVVTGKVKVSESEKQLALLTPSKSLRYNSRTKEVAVVHADTSNTLSWTRGIFQFEGETLADIARSLSRWYGYSFQFTNKSLEKCSYYLNLDNSISIEEAMNVLKEAAGVEVAINHNTKSISINGTSCQ